MFDFTEIDERIAREVMGFEKWPCCVHGDSIYDPEKGTCTPFRPSTNLLSAWQVLLRITELGYTASVVVRPENDVESNVRVIFYNLKDDLICVDDVFPPCAICEAALRVIDHESNYKKGK